MMINKSNATCQNTKDLCIIESLDMILKPKRNVAERNIINKKDLFLIIFHQSLSV